MSCLLKKSVKNNSYYFVLKYCFKKVDVWKSYFFILTVISENFTNFIYWATNFISYIFLLNKYLLTIKCPLKIKNKNFG